jgi:hypothetical protein
MIRHRQVPAAAGIDALAWLRFIACCFGRYAGLSAAFLERRINEEIEQGGTAFCGSRSCRPDHCLRASEDDRQLARQRRYRLEERQQRALLA